MEKSLIVKLDIKNPEVAADLKEVVSSVPGFMISSNGIPCDVMFVEIGHDLDKEFKLVEQIRAKGQAREIFLTSSRKDTEVLLKVLKTGVKEFFHQPLNRDDVIASLTKLKRSAETERSKKAMEKRGILISVIGSKGGVGATTMALNLAVCLKETEGGKSVALMDMNPLLGGIHLFFDIKTSFSWADGARDIARMDSTYLLNTLYKHPSGVHVLPAPSNPIGLEVATPETMANLVGLMLSAFDIVVIDGCKSFDELSLKMIALSDTILLVSELNLPAIINAKKILDTLVGLGFSHGKNIKIVINRYQKKNTISPSEAEKTLGRRIVAMIPNDYETTMTAINSGKTIADVAHKSALLENFRQLSALLLNKETVKKEKFRLSFVTGNFKELALRFHKGRPQE